MMDYRSLLYGRRSAGARPLAANERHANESGPAGVWLLDRLREYVLVHEPTTAVAIGQVWPIDEPCQERCVVAVADNEVWTMATTYYSLSAIEQWIEHCEHALGRPLPDLAMADPAGNRWQPDRLWNETQRVVGLCFDARLIVARSASQRRCWTVTWRAVSRGQLQGYQRHCDDADPWSPGARWGDELIVSTSATQAIVVPVNVFSSEQFVSQAAL
jgi:hypothetical protein